MGGLQTLATSALLGRAPVSFHSHKHEQRIRYIYIRVVMVFYMARKSNTRRTAPRTSRLPLGGRVDVTRTRGQGHPRRTLQAPPSPHRAGGGPLTNNDTHVTARQHSDQIDSTHSLSRLSTLSEPNSRYLALSLARQRKATLTTSPRPCCQDPGCPPSRRHAAAPSVTMSSSTLYTLSYVRAYHAHTWGCSPTPGEDGRQAHLTSSKI